MRRRIYLLRHGEPERAGNERRCIGRTDLELSDRGRHQAEMISRWISDKHIKNIYSSPLSRCVETAKIVQAKLTDKNEPAKDILICHNLQEMDAGEWENKQFSEIRECYPEEYEKRGRQIGTYAPPGGESFAQAGERFEKCMDQIRRQNGKNILVTAHAGVIRGYLCRVMGISSNKVFELPQPYAGVTILEENLEEFNRKLSVCRIGFRPVEFLDNEEILYLYQKFQTPEPVIRHMQAVAAYIEGLLGQFQGLVTTSESKLLIKAALVHDILRTEKNHAEKGAEILDREGYHEIAELVRMHHGSGLTENGREIALTELLFYADKRIQGDRTVTIEERFAKSRDKCKSMGAMQAHRRQYELAKQIESKLIREERVRKGEKWDEANKNRRCRRTDSMP